MSIKKQNKNIRNLYRGINEFKKGYQPRTNLDKDELTCLQIPTVFQVDGRITFVSY
jgi:hypothetical protein